MKMLLLPLFRPRSRLRVRFLFEDAHEDDLRARVSNPGNSQAGVDIIAFRSMRAGDSLDNSIHGCVRAAGLWRCRTLGAERYPVLHRVDLWLLAMEIHFPWTAQACISSLLHRLAAVLVSHHSPTHSSSEATPNVARTTI